MKSVKLSTLKPGSVLWWNNRKDDSFKYTVVKFGLGGKHESCHTNPVYLFHEESQTIYDACGNTQVWVERALVKFGDLPEKAKFIYCGYEYRKVEIDNTNALRKCDNNLYERNLFNPDAEVEALD